MRILNHKRPLETPEICLISCQEKKESSKRVSTIGEFPDEQARSLSTITNIQKKENQAKLDKKARQSPPHNKEESQWKQTSKHHQFQVGFHQFRTHLPSFCWKLFFTHVQEKNYQKRIPQEKKDAEGDRFEPLPE